MRTPRPVESGGAVPRVRRLGLRRESSIVLAVMAAFLGCERTTTPVDAAVDASGPVDGGELGGAAWERTNPGGGGAFQAVGVGPTGLLVVGSDLSGAYLSRDDGASWTPIGASQGVFSTHVDAVGFDPSDPEILYLGTDEGLFRSSDGGARFDHVLMGGYITDVRFAPSDPTIGYLAWHPAYDEAAGRVFRTDDRGLSWRPVDGELPSGVRVVQLFVDPTRPDAVYVLTGEDRFACGPAALLMSRDGGGRWVRVAPELGQVLDFAFDPSDSESFLLSTYGDVWDEGYDCVSDDPRGGRLYRVAPAGDGFEARPMAGALGSRNLLLWPAGACLRTIDIDEAAAFESCDAGSTWVSLGRREDWSPAWSSSSHTYGTSYGGDAKTIAADPRDPDRLYWVDTQFVYGTFDGGRHFASLCADEVRPQRWRSRGVDNVVPFELALDADGRHVYLGLADLGCFSSDDYGATWRNCNARAFTGTWDGAGGNSLVVATDPVRSGVVWVSQAQEIDSPHVLLRSDDFGRTWRTANAGLPGLPPSGLSIDPRSPVDRRILLLTAGGDVYRSTDDGEVWDRTLACGGCRFTAAQGLRIFAGGEAGLWRSMDGGGSWEPVGPPEFAGNGIDEFWDTAWAGVAAIRIDPSDPDRVLVAVFGEGRGVYESRDGGTHWVRLLAGDFLWDVAIGVEDPATLYAASSSALYSGGYLVGSAGVRLSRDGGASWVSWNEGLVWPFARRVVVDPRSPRSVWVVSPGLGVARRLHR